MPTAAAADEAEGDAEGEVAPEAEAEGRASPLLGAPLGAPLPLPRGSHPPFSLSPSPPTPPRDFPRGRSRDPSGGSRGSQIALLGQKSPFGAKSALLAKK